MTAASKQALDMTKGTGDNACTRYNPSVIDEALENKLPIAVAGSDKDGNPKRVLRNARRVHRKSLKSCYGETHKQAGKGKFIDVSALDGDKVTGANHVCPYLGTGSYATSIRALMSFAPKGALALLVGMIKKSRAVGEHIEWKGRRNEFDAVLVTPLVNGSDLWARAKKINPKLPGMLAAKKSGVKDVKEHLGVEDKFIQNIGVQRRARAVFNLATGETDETRGGATPCAAPLEQVGFAIDSIFMTVGFDKDGNEVGEFFYRLAIGRSIPWTLGEREWKGLEPGKKFAYKTEALRQRALKAK